MKTLFKHFVWFGAIAACAGLTVAWLGLVPIAASTDHWPPAKWFLHFTMRQTVRSDARGIEAPALDDPRLLHRGAGAYAFGCASCHGAPGQRPSLAASLMIPPAPPLEPGKWKTRELFWIVKNGIKYTAMPAWASQQRDDEVWAVVAFLLELPEMQASRYNQLAHGIAAEPGESPTAPHGIEEMLTGVGACASCHGFDGAGRDGTAPALAGQKEDYFATSLRDYAAGRRPSGVMQPIAAALSEREIAGLTRLFAAMPAPAARAGADEEAVQRGARIAESGIPDRDVAPCAACHDRDREAIHPDYPDLFGQDADYLAKQLRLFRDDARGHTATVALMRSVSGGLSETEARDVSLYYSAAGR
ncbi:MAG: c-type cytochrome [Panacagrimonas sp.]